MPAAEPLPPSQANPTGRLTTNRHPTPHGYVALRGAFDAATASACREMIWGALRERGAREDDSGTWPQVLRSSGRPRPAYPGHGAPRPHSARPSVLLMYSTSLARGMKATAPSTVGVRRGDLPGMNLKW